VDVVSAMLVGKLFMDIKLVMFVGKLFMDIKLAMFVQYPEATYQQTKPAQLS
jgi:hypothetical protein